MDRGQRSSLAFGVIVAVVVIGFVVERTIGLPIWLEVTASVLFLFVVLAGPLGAFLNWFNKKMGNTADEQDDQTGDW